MPKSSRKRLSFGSTGFTPRAKKKVNPSGAACRRVQHDLQEKVQNKLCFQQGSSIQRTELCQMFPNVSGRSIDYAVKRVYSQTYIHSGTLYNVGIRAKEDEPQHIPQEEPLNIVLRSIRNEVENLVSGSSLLKSTELAALKIEDLDNEFKTR